MLQMAELFGVAIVVLYLAVHLFTRMSDLIVDELEKLSESAIKLAEIWYKFRSRLALAKQNAYIKASMPATDQNAVAVSPASVEGDAKAAKAAA